MGMWEQLGLVVMVAVFVLYPGLAQVAFSVFACVHIDDGKGPAPENQQATWRYGYWVRNLNAECYLGTHKAFYVPIGIASILIFCLAPPLISLSLTWRVRKHLDEHHNQMVYGFLYGRYRREYFFWDSVVHLQSLALVAVDVFGRGMLVLYQALLLLSVLMLIALVNIVANPTRSRLLLLLEFCSQMVLCFTITLSLYFVDPDGSLADEAAGVFVGALILAVNVAMICFFFGGNSGY
ncbi:hypothetical protein HXX76_000679 [Chlamydomonas incerta]|uniref:TRP C-terminal domain-containing protein n=1 Tax=Chlamydomonas incerta TaxID=51695 RepID=A0A836B3A9_CHLIN|nr:hypothetical protein HXX76_000679 [Chlamydomonas incerta]|eukprot:KAG2446079.1 hypothetical protein HXX76_000679 [Chlamydomonas incerta]